MMNSFKAWKWHSAARHKKELDKWAAMRTKEGISKAAIRDIDAMIKALQEERAKYRKVFANEFKCTQRTLVKGIKFDKDTNSFRAKLVWTEEIPVLHPETEAEQDPDTPVKASHYDYVQQEEEINVEEEWVKAEFAPMFQQIINMRQDERHWTQVPRDVEYLIGKKKIVKVRYVPECKRSIVDTAALARRVEMEIRQRDKAKRKASKASKGQGKALQAQKNKRSKIEAAEERHLRSSPNKVQLKALDENADWEDEEEELNALKEEPPRTIITIKAKWLGKTMDGHISTLEEAYVRKTFGDYFTDELKQLN